MITPFFNLTHYLFAFIWCVILWAARFNYDRPVLLDIQDGGASHAAISRMGDLCGLSEFPIYLLNRQSDLSGDKIGRVPA